MNALISQQAFALAFVVAMLASAPSALADAPQSFMLQGTILTPAGLPQEATSVAFTIEIRSPGMEDCLLYREAHTLNMANSGGAFSLAIGSGTRTGGGFQETSTLKEVFDNAAANRTGLTCVTGTDYDATSGHTREIAVTFNDGSGPQTLTQVLQVQSVPYALYAENAAKLGGYLPTDLLRVNTLTRALSQSNLESVFFNQARVDELINLLDGASTQYVGTSSALDFTNNITMSGAGTSLAVTNASTFGGIISANNATASTSTGTGALVVAGGIGVAGAVNSGSTISAATSMRTPIIYGSSAASGTLTLQSTSDATKGNILINPNGGNVGIGTSSPSEKLHVEGTANQTVLVKSTGAGNHSILSLSAGAGGIAAISSAMPGSSTYFTNSASDYIMRIDTVNNGVSIGSGVGYSDPGSSSPPNGLIVKGNVGIGTVTPSDILHISSATPKYGILVGSVGAPAVSSGPYIYSEGRVYSGDGSAALPAYSFGIAGQEDNGMFRPGNNILGFSTAGTERIRIDDSGNVGIGTTSPGSPLTIQTSTAGNVELLSLKNTNGGGNATGIGFYVSGTKQSEIYSYDDNLSFNAATAGGSMLWRTNNTTRMTLDSAGNVGIGTAAPDQLLEMVRNQNATTATYIINSDPGASAAAGLALGTDAGTFSMGLASAASGGSASLWNSANSPLFLATNNLARVTVLADGKVGIGTISPSTALQVEGVISPSADNAHDLGTAGLRFQDIHAVNNVIQTSDVRLKKDIRESDLGLNFINRLRPVSYYWKQGDSHLHYGLIAQETEEVLASEKKTSGRPAEVDNVLVTHDRETDRYGVRYTELIAPIIKAIQELYSNLLEVKSMTNSQARQIASLSAAKADSDAKIEKLESENVELKSRLEKIEKLLSTKASENK